MALLDLGLVTRCFTTLLSERVPAFPDWPTGQALLVSAGAPELVNANHALSFYLYHVREDAHLKAQDWETSGLNPQRFKPMGLSLYFVMTPRSSITDANNRALADQLVMGRALKTLHETSVIDDTTMVDGLGGPVQVMPISLRGLNNRFRITLQPTASNEAANYWQAGTGALRLAAYYEVTSILLEPDQLMTRAGRVLVAGVHVMTRGRPAIQSIENRIEVVLPGSGETQRIDLSPASVIYGNNITVKGSDLKGDVTDFILAHRDFAEPLAVDASWGLASDGNTLTLTARAAIGAIPVLPGIYGAFVRTVMRKTLPDGSQRDFDAWSNQMRFAIAPAIVSVAGLGPVKSITVDSFEPHSFADGDIMVFAGQSRLARASASPPGPGEYFAPNSPAAARKTIRFRYPAGTPVGATLPLRIIVRGAESPPRWEVVT
jgi:Pvc16 N-terminal domain